jgi:ABC-type transporter Mla subunit MlaD
MPEDVFRIVVTVGVVLGAIAFVAQAVTTAIMSRAIGQLRDRTAQLMDRSEPVMDRLGPAIVSIQAFAEKAGPVIEKAGPVLEKVGPALESAGIFLEGAVPAFQRAVPVVDRAGQILATTQRILDENRPHIAEFTGEVAGIARTGREQVERLGELLHEAGGRARARLDQIENVMDSTVGQVELAGDAMKRAVLRPVREANGIAAGISAAVSTLVRGRKFSVESATQDEEMFI